MRLKVTGISELTFNLMDRRLGVEHTLADEQPILDALREIGMNAVPVTEADTGSKSEAATHFVSRRTWIFMTVSGIAAITSEIIVWSGAGEQSLAVIALALLSIATGGLGNLKKGWIALKNFTLNMNFLMSIATIGAIAIGQWPEAAVVIFLFALSELIVLHMGRSFFVINHHRRLADPKFVKLKTIGLFAIFIQHLKRFVTDIARLLAGRADDFM